MRPDAGTKRLVIRSAENRPSGTGQYRSESGVKITTYVDEETHRVAGRADFHESASGSDESVRREFEDSSSGGKCAKTAVVGTSCRGKVAARRVKFSIDHIME